MSLEILSAPARGARRGAPLLFVHGGFLGAWCWAEHFLPGFAAQGYDAHAVSLRGHGASAGRDALDLAGLDDYAADVQLAASRIGDAPVLIGHSMGAVVVQRAARRCNARALVLLAPLPPSGFGGTAVALALRDPSLYFAINTMQLGLARAPEIARIRHWLFSASVPEADVARYLARMQRESQRALLELAWPQHFWMRDSVGIPAIVAAGADDAFFTAAMIEEAARFHAVQPHFFTGVAHALMLEPGWEAVACYVQAWLEERMIST